MADMHWVWLHKSMVAIQVVLACGMEHYGTFIWRQMEVYHMLLGLSNCKFLLAAGNSKPERLF